jgi:hypothetical protein
MRWQQRSATLMWTTTKMRSPRDHLAAAAVAVAVEWAERPVAVDGTVVVVGGGVEC